MWNLLFILLSIEKIGTAIINVFNVLDKHVRGTLGAKSLKTIIWSTLKRK